jgi:predicted flavoprotein YhiN
MPPSSVNELPNQEIWDVIIIGGGAAGLMAAASAAGRGKRTLLVEKNRKLGVKILMSGGTRCNITHHCDARGIIEGFGKNGQFLHSALAALSPGQVISMINAQGVATKVESTGKIFPASDRAIDVRDALARLAEQAGAKILAGVAVENIEVIDPESPTKSHSNPVQFIIQTAQAVYHSQTVIITTGGKSYPGCGTTGDGYQWAEQFGHSIVTPRPALTPILSNCPWALELKGITLERVRVCVIERPEAAAETETQQKKATPHTAAADASPSAGSFSAKLVSGRPVSEKFSSSKSVSGKFKPRVLAERESSFLFTHWGFSGPAALDVSREIARHPNRKQLELVCDFWPQQTSEQLIQQFMQHKLAHPKQLGVHLLPAELPRRFNESLLEVAGIPADLRNADLPKQSIQRLVEQLKQTRFPITGTLGFEKAEVTSGGVSLQEIDSKTMQSKLLAGLFFAGEILDLDGRIGGYNFQSAFSTGWLAGRSV